MSLTVAQHYRILLARSGEAFETLLSDYAAAQKLTVANNFISDLELLHSAVATRPEGAMIKLAARELNFALYAAAAAKYRHATISLRLCLELALAAVLFSAYEIRLRKWLNNAGDIVWGSLIDLEEGVFSKSFIQVFAPEMSEHGRQYAAICAKVYRECSEFVHGNNNTHAPDDQAIIYNKTLFYEWADRLAAVRISVLFAFSCRYLAVIPKEDAERVEAIILDGLGHLTPVRLFYEKASK